MTPLADHDHHDDEATAAAVLDQLQVSAAEHISLPLLRHTADARVTVDRVAGHLAANLTGLVLGKRLPPDTHRETVTLTVEVPASPWQHWKHAHRDTDPLTRWLARVRPPRMRTISRSRNVIVDVERAAFYPHADVLPHGDRLGDPVLVVTGPRPRHPHIPVVHWGAP